VYSTLRLASSTRWREESTLAAAETDLPDSEVGDEPVAEAAEAEVAEEAAEEVVAPVEEASEEPGGMDWYILKVQSNREDSIAEALRRRVKIEGLESFFDQSIVPTEKVTEFNKAGKKRVVKRKLYPNVDFYSGILYRAMGIPTEMFTVMFALGRLPGWIAQWKEMRTGPGMKIGRPRQIYQGEAMRPFVPLEKRDQPAVVEAPEPEPVTV